MSAEISTIRENPFSNSTDPRLAYFDMPRRNTIARLLTGLYQGDGLFLLVGEEGIGKTTLLRHLGVQVAALSGVRLLHTTAFVGCCDQASFANIVDGCAANFGSAGVDPLQFARLLQDLAADGEQMPAILVDDADRLDDAGLRAIATLTTLRGGERRLLSAVLAGTRELPQRLAKISGVADRLTAGRVIQLSGMSRGEVERMIRHRLRQMGRADVEEALQPGIVELAGQCNGVPLQVLGLCRRALHTAETPAPRLSSPVSAPVSVAADAGCTTDAIKSAAATDFVAATAPGSTGVTTESAADGNARPAAAVVSPSAGEAAVESFVGAVSAQSSEAPADVATGRGSFAEFQGHIRYTAASARRVESARWQSGAPRRRRGRRASLAVGSMLVVLAAGWAVYDHTPRRIVNSGSAHTRVVDPLTASALAPALLPPPLTPSPPLVPPPTSAPEIQSTTAPVLPGAASPAESEWRSSSLAEGPGGDVQLAPSDTTGSPTGSVPFALPFPSVANDGGEKAANLSSPPPDRQTARRELPERPAARSSTQAASSQPAPRSAPPTATPRPAAVTAVSAKPVAAEAMSARSTEAKQMPRSRQKDALLMEGDEHLLAGEVEAARATYQEAFDRGSAEAARRLGQTFDPRNVSATSTEGSAAEAILWYKDAAKRGDRRARGELQGLESWLEDAAASGNGEARRVLKTWRAPPPADDPAGGSQAEP